MIKSIEFENFKGFDSLKLEDLTRCNLISGMNNVGKSSVLEGIFLYLDHVAAESFLKISNFRGIVVNPLSTKIWDVVFKNTDPTIPLSIKVVDEEGVESKLTYQKDSSYLPSDLAMNPEVLKQFVYSAKSNYALKYTFKKDAYEEKGHFVIGQPGILANCETSLERNEIERMQHAQYINNAISTTDMVINDWFGQAELEGRKSSIVSLLKIIEPKINDITLISAGGQPQLYTNINGRLMPMKLSGDGINRLLYIILSIYENPDSVILIDEIENGFHYSLYVKLWELIVKAANDANCQVFATTHSLECIEGAVAGIPNNDALRTFSYYRLDRNGTTKAHRFSYDMMQSAIKYNMEVR